MQLESLSKRISKGQANEVKKQAANEAMKARRIQDAKNAGAHAAKMYDKAGLQMDPAAQEKNMRRAGKEGSVVNRIFHPFDNPSQADQEDIYNRAHDALFTNTFQNMKTLEELRAANQQRRADEALHAGAQEVDLKSLKK
jgi:hypothetical protein